MSIIRGNSYMNKREAFKQLKNIKLCFENAAQHKQESCREVAIKKLHSLTNEAPPSISYELGCITAYLTSTENKCDIPDVLKRLERLTE